MSRPLVLAHRGARRRERENTVPAFERAFEVGADGVELDVRCTADHCLVVHHDAQLPGAGVLAEVPLAAARRAAPWLPTLAEALDACSGRLVNVEIKNQPWEPAFDPAERVVAAVAELLVSRGRRDHVVVSSFHLATIDRMLELGSEVETALLTFEGIDPYDGLLRAHEHGHRSFHPALGSVVGDAAGVLCARAHALGMRVTVWTVNEPAEMHRLATAGVDGIVTDVPDVAVAELA
jgi:glycerophosphoryl diester phosphodiesterase